jgi:hypothetical protein
MKEDKIIEIVDKDVVDTHQSTEMVQSKEAMSASILLVESWDERTIIAEKMLEGNMIPSTFSSPESVISVIEMGTELGMGPWASLNNIITIQGKVTLTLNAMLSIARSKGVLINVIKDYELTETTVRTKDGPKKVHDRATTVVITRGEDVYSPSGKLLDSRVSEYTYTKYWQEAVKAELTTKDNWKRMPRQMLRARTITEALRLYAADIILGMYESTEIGDANNVIIDIKE